jgi:HSP20 family protein
MKLKQTPLHGVASEENAIMNTHTMDKPETTTATTTAEHTWNHRTFQPSVDIHEGADGLIVTADLPGTRREDIDIHFENGTLTLQGKVRPRQNDKTPYLLNEYDVGDFYRSFAVSELIDASRISAEYKDGVLTLRLPKVESAKPRKIEVKVA